MSSDPPPPTDPITNTDNLFTPEPYRPSNLNVITQDTENASRTINFSSTPAGEEVTTFQEHQHTYTEEWLYNHGRTDESPLVEPSTFPHVPTPTVESPTISKSQIRTLVDSNTMEGKEIAAAARSMVFMSNQSQKKRSSPKSSFLTFLRRDQIDGEIVNLEREGVSSINTEATLGQARRGWYWQRSIGVEQKFFKLKKEMQKAFKANLLGPTLTPTHHRMMLEDIMGLQANKEVILLIHQSHKFVSGKENTWWSKRIISIAANYSKSNCHFVQFQDNLFWAVKGKIRNNPRRNDLHRKIHTDDEIRQGCTKRGGWGITIELPTGELKDILFCDFLADPIHLQLWMHANTTNYTRISTKLRDLCNPTALSATVRRLIDEAYGDATLTQEICYKYLSRIRDQDDETKDQFLSDAPVSSRKIKHQYSLKANDPAFVAFRQKVESKLKASVQSTYGQFNTITSPLLSYTEVSSLSLCFTYFSSP